ncbi:MAG: 50S ribosomal protein L11 methyltransferase [Kaiparowitsia implicata GSE-PSE-MK54-09C]|jgi:ribosomal protein L11 methyltransferase|nr:50S ribosomal protein L11 methyltransferase [Kaiparowitsia implicata GSE-PSE-MK54-09C]
MPWIELHLTATAEAIDWIRTLLATHDVSAQVQVIPQSQSNPDRDGPDWPYAVQIYLPYSAQAQSQVRMVERSLYSLQRTRLTSAIELRQVETPPPEALLQGQAVGDRLWIVSGNAPVDPQQAGDRHVLRLSPGLAFGSGLHPATVLSLRLLQQFGQAGMTAVDVGCGSGILSLALAALGATVTALDNDPVAAQATRDALALNPHLTTVTVVEGSLGQGSTLGHWMGGPTIESGESDTGFMPSDRVDMIVANLFARIHSALAADYHQALKPGGLLIAAGFTSDYDDDLTTVMQAEGLRAIARETQADWRAIAFQRV